MEKFIFLLLFIGTLLIALLLYIGFFIPKEIEIKSVVNSIEDLLIVWEEERARMFLPLFGQVRNRFIAGKVSFLEIDFPEKMVRVYKEGLIKKEVPILARGDPQTWGGTAAGIYNVKRKFVSSFSVAAEVYMPWAIHFYGKYYVHGEPYYPGGYPLISSVSGGCIRLSNKDAEAIYVLTEVGMPVLVIDSRGDGYEYKEAVPKEPQNISASAYLAADLNSGFVLAEKNPKQPLPIASLTKLMTALVIAENKDLKRWTEVEEEMLEAYGSTKGLEAGARFRIVELFYPLLIESSNDAAEVLTSFLGREKTIRLMNEKARAILMEKTEFTCPSGYDPGNVSTVRDLFYLARYIYYNRPPIFKITKGEKVPSYGPIDFDIEKLWNKNIFINDPTFVGGKTGFIKTSKEIGLFVFKLKTTEGVERNIVIIVLGSDNEELDTQKIYSWLVNNYFQESTVSSEH